MGTIAKDCESLIDFVFLAKIRMLSPYFAAKAADWAFIAVRLKMRLTVMYFCCIMGALKNLTINN